MNPYSMNIDKKVINIFSISRAMAVVFIVFSIFFSMQVLSQNFGGCGNSDFLTLMQTTTANCQNQSSDWSNKYRTPSFWIPSNTTPIKTILVNWVICQNNDGHGSWEDSQAFRDEVDLMFTNLNNIYGNSPPMGYALTCPPIMINISDSKIRWKLNEIIFIKNSTFNNFNLLGNPGLAENIFDYLEIHHPNYKNALTHIFNMPTNFPNAWGYYSINAKGDSYVYTRSSMFNPSYVVWDDHVRHIVHEYGHAVGLHHTYDSEQTEISNYDFLDDVFGLCPENGFCVGSQPTPGHICYLSSSFWTSQPQPNPIMSGVPGSWYISPKSMGRMHRALSLFDNSFILSNHNMNKYVEEDHSYSVPLLITQNETWDFAVKMYQDLIVTSGITLTVKCEIRMPIEGKIIIEPNAKLVIDGGKITSAHNDLWQGIEIWGNSHANQYTENGVCQQGFLELKNGAIIEHAHYAVRLWNPENWGSTGGIIKATDANFLNNWKSIEFISYHNHYPGTTFLAPNQSIFQNCRFEIDDQFMLQGFDSQVSLFDVEWVDFKGCLFTDKRTGITNSSEKGNAVFSLDATYTVEPYCNGTNYQPPCPENYLIKPSFTNFNTAVHASNSITNGHTIHVYRADFDGNYIGISTYNVSKSSIVGCNFNVGNYSGIDKSENYGLYLNYSSDYAIEENHFTGAESSFIENYGVYIFNSGKSYNEIYRNYFENLTFASRADALNRDAVQSSIYGLQFICNQYADVNLNQHDISAFQVQNMPDFQNHGIRDNQGWNSCSTGNSHLGSITVEGNIQNVTQNPFRYYFNGDTSDWKYTGGGLVNLISSPGNQCPCRHSLNEPEDKISATQLNDLKSVLQISRTDFINLLYVYNQLINGGSTNEILEEIQMSWPANAWTLRQNLLNHSPYLTEEVIKATANQNALPTAMLLEVCLANPDATRSEALLEFLAYVIPNPLPTYMIDLICASRDSTTTRTNLERILADYYANYSYLGNRINSSLITDPDLYDSDSLMLYTGIRNNLSSKYAEIDLLIQNGNFNQAEDSLNIMPLIFNLTTDEFIEYGHYCTWFNFRKNLALNHRSVLQLDSTEIEYLKSIENNYQDKVGVAIRNVLCFGYSYCAETYINETGSIIKHRAPVIHPGKKNIQVLVYPNPANTYLIFDFYHLKDKEIDCIQLTDSKGVIIRKENLISSASFKVLDCGNIISGMYYYTILLKNGLIHKGKVEIQH